jgi:hypothetical protein
MTDDELVRFFDYTRVKDREGTPKAAKEMLKQHGELYRAQLVAAKFAEGWRKRTVERDPSPSSPDRKYLEGFNSALREMTAHLLLGDFLPGGTLYRQEMGK